MRIDHKCASNKRSMERRVAKKGPTDVLSKWWKDLPKTPDKEMAWYKKMKAKEKYSHMSDDQIMVEAEETQSKGLEQRDRTRYYGYAKVVEDHPNLSETACLDHWTKLVEKSTDKITDKNGDVFIARAREIVVDHVANNMATSRIKRQKTCKSADDMADAVQANLQSLDRFARTLQLSRPISMAAIPLEARQVDSIGSNTSESIMNALGKAVLQQAIQQQMVQVLVQETQEEAEMMADVQQDMEKIAQAQKEHKYQLKQSPIAQKTAFTTLKTVLIEKSAKLDSSIVRMRADLQQPDMDASMLEGADMGEVNEAAGSIKFSWGQFVALPSQAASLAPPVLGRGEGGEGWGTWAGGG